jgi:hypothetical protein
MVDMIWRPKAFRVGTGLLRGLRIWKVFVIARHDSQETRTRHYHLTLQYLPQLIRTQNNPFLFRV